MQAEQSEALLKEGELLKWFLEAKLWQAEQALLKARADIKALPHAYTRNTADYWKHAVGWTKELLRHADSPWVAVEKWRKDQEKRRLAL